MAALGLCHCTQAFSSYGRRGCSSWLLPLGSAGSPAPAHPLRCAGLTDPEHVASSSQARGQTRAPDIGRPVLNHQSARGGSALESSLTNVSTWPSYSQACVLLPPHPVSGGEVAHCARLCYCCAQSVPDLGVTGCGDCLLLVLRRAALPRGLGLSLVTELSVPWGVSRVLLLGTVL